MGRPRKNTVASIFNNSKQKGPCCSRMPSFSNVCLALPLCRPVRPSRCAGLTPPWATEGILRCEGERWGGGHGLSCQGRKGQAQNTGKQQGRSQGRRRMRKTTIFLSPQHEVQQKGDRSGDLTLNLNGLHFSGIPG